MEINLKSIKSKEIIEPIGRIKIKWNQQVVKVICSCLYPYTLSTPSSLEVPTSYVGSTLIVLFAFAIKDNRLWVICLFVCLSVCIYIWLSSSYRIVTFTAPRHSYIIHYSLSYLLISLPWISYPDPWSISLNRLLTAVIFFDLLKT